MQLQRRLGGLERDLQAIEQKVQSLEDAAKKLMEIKPQEANKIDENLHVVMDAWDEMKHMLVDREARLKTSEEMQRFLQNLDHFQMWLSKAHSSIASQDLPNGTHHSHLSIFSFCSSFSYKLSLISTLFS